MTITEPMTMLTDWALAALAVFWGLRLVRRKALPVRLWGLAFLALALGAFAGGSAHGFATQLGDAGGAVAWKLTFWAIGIAGFLLVAGVLHARLRPPLRTLLLAVAALKLAAYLSWMTIHSDFVWVIRDYGSSLLVVLAIEIWAWVSRRAAAGPWIVAAIAVSFLAAGVQVSGFALHRHFNHNDLYHVVQMLGLYLYYRGGLLLSGSGGRDVGQEPH